MEFGGGCVALPHSHKGAMDALTETKDGSTQTKAYTPPEAPHAAIEKRYRLFELPVKICLHCCGFLTLIGGIVQASEDCKRPSNMSWLLPQPPLLTPEM